MLYDIHCHLFNKDILAKWLRVLVLLGDLERHIAGLGGLQLVSEFTSGLDFLRRLRRFLDIGAQEDSIAVYEGMRDVYHDGYVAVPLMLDLSYISTAEEYRRIVERLVGEDWLVERMDRIMDGIREKAGVRPGTVLAQIIDSIGHAKNEVAGAFHALTARMGEEEETDRIPVFDAEKSFRRQVRQLAALKERYGDMVYPFLGVDPRRPGIVDAVREYVGPGRIFHGVKLYPPLGFSPTDPVLMGADGLYAHCEAGGIPVTSHCSSGGFATYADRVRVSGHIYDAETDDVVAVENADVEFAHPFFPDPRAAIGERARTLNHPRIWKKVVDAFPGLTLNLAHLGGDSGTWRRLILDMMTEDNRLYSDLSCHTDPDVLAVIHGEVFGGAPAVARERLMYGSDYYIVMVFTDDLGEYHGQFVRIFGDDLEVIAGRNAERFLFEH